MAGNAARATVLGVLAAFAAPGCAAAEPACPAATRPACVAPPTEPALFKSGRLTPCCEYTSGIEGPAVDAGGTLYVVNFQQQGTIGIGKLSPGAARSELFATLLAGSVGNGIRFDRDGRMYVADFKGHNVLVFERGQIVPRVYFHSDGCRPGGRLPCFNQPNDLAVAADGTLYASDPNFTSGRGQIWRITRGPDGNVRGEVMSSERHMGATNGLDLSPDGATLYVSESSTPEDCKPPSTARCVWAYRLDGATLTAPRLVKKFEGFDLDGLRTDLDGRIFVTRPGNGTVAVLAPDGTLVREIPLRGKQPSNLTFGGPDGKTVFVTQVDGRFIEAFRVDRPGREPCLQTPDAC
jgi:sugar lactone lactonase YvrE